MQKVNSFIVDHTRLEPGIYESKVNGSYTYDIRFVAPRDAAHNGLYMKPEVAHTLEHFLADFLRTKADGVLSEENFAAGSTLQGQFSDKVLYVGPMGCLTGFYLLTTVPFDPYFIRDLILKALDHILSAREGEIPGASELTCGNWQYFDLEGTKDFIRERVKPNFTSNIFSTVYPLIEA